jgi:ABC-type Fe3+ transport system permease subunit
MSWATIGRATTALIYAGVGGLFGYVIALAIGLAAARFIWPELGARPVAIASVAGAALAGIAAAIGYLRSEPPPTATEQLEQPAADKRGPDEHA